jgi:hypothetical protein
MARTAEVKRDAQIGKAQAQMETLIKQSVANEQLMQSKLDNETQVRLSVNISAFYLNEQVKLD